MKSEDFEASVGVSREWDAREAGREVARNTLEDLDNDPSFFLLFSTIHYKDNGGFQEFLEGVWENLPEDTPLIGGTVAGFISPGGVYTRGASALAVSYENMDVATGLGKHTKRNPKKAGKKCADMIKEELKKSEYEKKVLINFISGAKIPKIPLIGVNMVKSKWVGRLLSHFGMRISAFLGTGVGKEEDVVEELSSNLPDFYFLGGTNIDEFKYLTNYQFINRDILTNSVVALGFCSDIPISLEGEKGTHYTGKSCEITGTAYEDRIITKIEGEPAGEYYFKEFLEIPKDQFGELDSFYHKVSDYFPLGFEGYPDYTSGTGAILGDNILLGYKVKGKNLKLLSVTGKEVIRSVEEVLDLYRKDKPEFPLFFSSGIRMNLLGNKTFNIKEKIDSKVRDSSYLLLYFTNENMKLPEEKAVNEVYSCNAMLLGGENEGNR